MGDDGIRRSAIFSPCETWRYTLERYWDGDGISDGICLFVLLNPSTADATYDDRTNVRGQGFARSWGYGGVVFVNLFAFRTPKPTVMKRAPDPVGPDNDHHIIEQADRAAKIVLAWGADGVYRHRDLAVRKLLKGRELWHLGLTQAGHPRHPLYLKADTPLQRWELP